MTAMHRISELIFPKAYMYLLLGDSRMERSDYDGAMQSFERARAQMRRYEGVPLLSVSLVSISMATL